MVSPYIPRGYFTTSDAVEYTFRSRNPDLAATALARSAEMRRLYEHYCSEFPGGHPIPARLADAIRLRDAAAKRRAIMMDAVNWRDTAGIHRQTESQLEDPLQPTGAFGEEDLARLRELDRIATEQHRLIADAAVELRTALAEGDLVAVLNHEEMQAVSRFRWREDDGLTIVREGRLSHQVGGTRADSMSCTVLIKEVDLMRWLGLSLQTGDEATNHLAGQTIEASVQANPSHSRTGAQGRPSSMHLILAELNRRRQANETLLTQEAESNALAVWLPVAHPEAPPVGAKGIRNSARSKLREAVEIAKARK